MISFHFHIILLYINLKKNIFFNIFITTLCWDWAIWAQHDWRLAHPKGRPEAQSRGPSIHQLFICPFIKGAFPGGFDTMIKPYVQPTPGTINSDGTKSWLNIRFNHSIESSWECPLYKGTNKQLVDWRATALGL